MNVLHQKIVLQVVKVCKKIEQPKREVVQIKNCNNRIQVIEIIDETRMFPHKIEEDLFKEKD